jgi:hypothetical protein
MSVLPPILISNTHQIIFLRKILWRPINKLSLIIILSWNDILKKLAKAALHIGGVFYQQLIFSMHNILLLSSHLRGKSIMPDACFTMIILATSLLCFYPVQFFQVSFIFNRHHYKSTTGSDFLNIKSVIKSFLSKLLKTQNHLLKNIKILVELPVTKLNLLIGKLNWTNGTVTLQFED